MTSGCPFNRMQGYCGCVCFKMAKITCISCHIGRGSGRLVHAEASQLARWGAASTASARLQQCRPVAAETAPPASSEVPQCPKLVPFERVESHADSPRTSATLERARNAHQDSGVRFLGAHAPLLQAMIAIGPASISGDPDVHALARPPVIEKVESNLRPTALP